MVDENGKAESKAAAKYLKRARKRFYAGQQDGREFEQAQKQMRARIAA